MLDLLGLEHIGDGGIALALIIAAVIIVTIVSGVLRSWLNVIAANNKARNDNEAKKVQNEEKQTTVLEEVGRQLAVSAQAQSGLTTVLETLGKNLTSHDTASSKAHELTHGKIDAALTTMQQVTQAREQRLDKIDTAIGEVPAAVKVELEPQLDTLKALIEQSFDQLSRQIEAKLDQLGSQISPAARRIIKTEIETYMEQNTRRLGALTDILDSIQRMLADQQTENEKESSSDG